LSSWACHLPVHFWIIQANPLCQRVYYESSAALPHCSSWTAVLCGHIRLPWSAFFRDVAILRHKQASKLRLNSNGKKEHAISMSICVITEQRFSWQCLPKSYLTSSISWVTGNCCAVSYIVVLGFGCINLKDVLQRVYRSYHVTTSQLTQADLLWWCVLTALQNAIFLTKLLHIVSYRTIITGFYRWTPL